jgi:hypothetical protein
MKMFALPCLRVILLAALLCTGCRSAFVGQTVESVGNHLSNSGCYQVDFLGVTESSEVASTWSYRVEEKSCAQKLISWMLELPVCASVVEASPTPWGVISSDPAYQMSGIQWQPDPDFQDGEFSVMLTGDLETGITRAGVEGQELSLGSLKGPVCKGTASKGTASKETMSKRTTSPASAIAKVKVQSANCRARPAGKAKKITLLYRNQEAEIVGRNDDPNNPWWYIKIPAQSGNCWLWGRTASISGNVEGLPIIK